MYIGMILIKIWRYNIKTNKTEQIGLECKYIELDF